MDMDTVVSWILDKAPVIGILIVVAVLTWIVSRYFRKLEESQKKIEKLPCDDHRTSIDHLSRMEEKVDLINDQVTEISKWIMSIDGNMINALARKCSPRRMTKIGNDLFEISGAQKVMSNNSEFFIKELEAINPQTPYDVENDAAKVLFGNISHPMFNEIKAYLYESPDSIEMTDENGQMRTIRLSLISIIQLMTLNLRDRYLARHPEIQ